jgi:hypothetical protein
MCVCSWFCLLASGCGSSCTVPRGIGAPQADSRRMSRRGAIRLAVFCSRESRSRRKIEETAYRSSHRKRQHSTYSDEAYNTFDCIQSRRHSHPMLTTAPEPGQSATIGSHWAVCRGSLEGPPEHYRAASAAPCHPRGPRRQSNQVGNTDASTCTQAESRWQDRQEGV